ncbi:hypothetical protein [Bifidobacterium pullorum]|uniref:hypothetical protein n=1 Tax=Bifidobacterium pullorum TaxID=78448 RepID=UPI003209B70A
MPWWIWLVLVVFMLVMLIAGLAYAALHLWRAFGKVSRTGAVIGEHMAAFQDTASSEELPEPPLFTQPLSVASERYSQAHAEVIRRREAKRSRHVEAWARWRRFNND